MEHHNLDIYPLPKDQSPLYINEPWMIDEFMWAYDTVRDPSPEKAGDNVRM